jgi:hypothetical protein
MRARRALAIPAIAVLVVVGLIVAGCGGSSDSAGNDTTLKSQNAAETSKSDDAMKNDGDAMKNDGDAMKKESGDAMKNEAASTHDEGSMKQDEAMKNEEG